ncbi:uncharacterized protein LOC128467567 [Spea bombifrons]|uniref:uncharacterized protein LOC128467567 n=1 Tax=Spea bombifrons TaxID=233779 RepID=UPI00234A76DE|nr:uncharacterized protein LOC128467567 [Spea bombifrons]
MQPFPCLPARSVFSQSQLAAPLTVALAKRGFLIACQPLASRMCPADLPSLLLLHLLLIAGSADSLAVSANRSHVTGYEKTSITLSVSYNISEPTAFLQIRWLFHKPPPKILAMCTITSGQIQHYTAEGYEQRVRIVPETGSLVINRLQKSDSGLYQLLIHDRSSINITVEVLGFYNWSEATDEPPKSSPCICSSAGLDLSTSAWIFLGSRLSSVIIALSVLCGLHLFHKKPKPYERRRRVTPDSRY